jgi:membrane protein
MGADDATHMAASVSYYAVLSLFPLILALVALFSLFFDATTVQESTFDFFRGYLPGTADLLESNIRVIIRLRGAVGLLSLIGLFWSSSALFGAISRSVNRAWDVHHDRPFYIAKARHLTMAAGVCTLFLFSFTITSGLEVVSRIDFPLVGRLSFLESDAASLTSKFLPFFFSLPIFLIIYKFIPNTKTYWRYIWPGALLAAILFEFAKGVFVFYLGRFANYEETYGSLASVAALLIWTYVSGFILILGAEFSSEYGRLREGVGRGTLLSGRSTKRPKSPSRGARSS